MYAIEFEAKPENGNIKIPEIYRQRLAGTVRVIILKAEENAPAQRGKRMAEILQSIADSGGLGIADPLAWQCETRRDRPLPFRED